MNRKKNKKMTRKIKRKNNLMVTEFLYLLWQEEWQENMTMILV